MSAAALQSRLPERGLRPVAELASGRPHGDRLRYMAGCRCDECRRANTEYEKARARARKAGEWNGIVSAATARAHLAKLSEAAVGKRTVADVTGLRYAYISQIANGSKQRIRASAERAILAVSTMARADKALVDAGPTWQRLDELIALGYTKVFLAQQLGKARALQLNRHQVTVRNAYEVERLHARLRHTNAAPTLDRLAELSEEGFHRSRVLRLLGELAAERQQDAPDLTVRNGQIRLQTAQLVQDLHRRLIEEDTTCAH